ncbi:MAG TPA: SurA N-terminal domain-containing protein [Chthoniobacter sp.]|jgi:peptidyl-prolyl cis-trans isomerase SurA
MPRFTLLILTFAFGLQRLAATAHGGVVGEVASYGQKDIISFSELREEAGPKEKPLRETLKGQALVDQIELNRKEIVETMIDRILILQEARSKGIELPYEAADVRVEAVIKEKFAGNRLAFERHLAAEGWTVEKFRTRESEEILVEQRREHAREGAATDEDAQRQETDWIKSLRQHAYIKVFYPLYPDVLD